MGVDSTGGQRNRSGVSPSSETRIQQMTLPKIHLVAAARPNFMKVAPVYHALRREDWCEPIIIHTGQHYDASMSDAFLDDLGLPAPHHHLGIGSGSHAEQTGKVMIAYERILMDEPPAWVIVVGDVNSTMACTIAAKKLWIPVAHLEAGLRSGDRTMPEEINRLVTDAIADLLWTPSANGDENLLREGVLPERISLVGNVMIDSYELVRPKIEAEETHAAFGLEPGSFGVVTLHRPSNVDHMQTLTMLVDTLCSVAERVPLVFAVHPRTKKSLGTFGLAGRLENTPGIHLSEPMSYIRFMGLVRSARLIVTDSGGLQEETTYLGIPCLTLRDTTERPITVSEGTNRLVPPPRSGSGRLAGACRRLADGSKATSVGRGDRRAGRSRSEAAGLCHGLTDRIGWTASVIGDVIPDPADELVDGVSAGGQGADIGQEVDELQLFGDQSEFGPRPGYLQARFSKRFGGAEHVRRMGDKIDPIDPVGAEHGGGLFGVFVSVQRLGLGPAYGHAKVVGEGSRHCRRQRFSISQDMPARNQNRQSRLSVKCSAVPQSRQRQTVNGGASVFGSAWMHAGAEDDDRLRPFRKGLSCEDRRIGLKGIKQMAGDIRRRQDDESATTGDPNPTREPARAFPPHGSDEDAEGKQGYWIEQQRHDCSPAGGCRVWSDQRDHARPSPKSLVGRGRIQGKPQSVCCGPVACRHQAKELRGLLGSL